MLTLKGSFIKNLVKQNRIGLVIIFVIPAILFSVFYLPSNTREMLVLHRDYSNIYDVFTTHFVHEDFSHLTLNITVYVIVALMLYALLLALDQKKLFYKLFIANCLLLPFLISLAWIPMNKFIWAGSVRTLGFSGVVSSFIGSLIFAYVLFLRGRFKISSLYAYSSSISLVALLFVLIYFTFTLRILAIASFVLILFAWSTYKTIKSIDQKAKMELIEKSKKPILVNMLPFNLYLMIFLFCWSLFPTQFVQGNIAINFLIHYDGFIPGIAVSYMIHFIDQRRKDKTISGKVAFDST